VPGICKKMKEEDMAMVIIGLGFFGLLGFLAFLYFRREYPYFTYPAPKTEIRPTPIIEKPLPTEEVRPTVPHIINYVLTQANKWYEIKLPKDIVTWQMKARGNYDLYYSYEPSHSTYMTLTSGSVLSEDTAPNMSIQAIYVMSKTAGAVVELEVWKNA